MTDVSSEGISFVVGGSVTGAGVSTAIGGIGLVGSFGGIGIGMGIMTGVGAIAGAAAYGTAQAVTDKDATVIGAIGLGSLGGIGVSTTVGGIGLGIGGTAIGLGVGSMALAGGVVGLGIYGIGKIFNTHQVSSNYWKNVQFLQQITEEYETERLWLELEQSINIEEDLNSLKADFSFQTQNYNDYTSPSENNHFNLPEIEESENCSWQCITVLKGHQKAVNSLAFSPDDQTLASGSDDRTVKLWDINEATSIYTFVGCSAEIQTVAISSDGNLLIAGGFDQRITAWTLKNKALFSSFFGSVNSPNSHNGAICQVAIEKNRRFIVSGGTDGKVRVWNGYTGELQRTLNEHSATVWSVSISPNGEIIASGSADQTIKLWTKGSIKSYCTLSGHLGEVTAIAISPDGKSVISGSTDGSLKIWDILTGELQQIIIGHHRTIFTIAISPNGEILASADAQEVKLWNLKTGELIEKLLGCHPVSFSSSGKFIATGNHDRGIKIWYQKLDNSQIALELETDYWWSILGVSKNATLKEVKQAYRSLVRLYHPDLNKSNDAIKYMQIINRAYQTFLDSGSIQSG